MGDSETILKVEELKQITTLHVKSFLSYIDLGRRFLVSGVSPVNAIINCEPENSHREQSKSR